MYANRTLYLAGFSYNLSSISVRMYHSPDTNASVSRLEGIRKDSVVVSGITNPAFEVSVLNSPNSRTFFNDKISNFFEDTGEACEIFLHHLKEEKIVPAFTKAKSEHKKSLLNLVSFDNLVSPESLRNAWVQLKSKPSINIRGIVSGALNSIENV